ncbi:MAG: ribosome-associated translation inhibitor RaiA [Actinomycetota bacterium]|nr:ribosome-associated translation inhibitor RaiA [Actinomycetota bacterium]
MQVIIKSKNVELTDSLREYVMKEISKIEKLGVNLNGTEVMLKAEKNPKIKESDIVELTANGNGMMFRGTGTGPDLYMAFERAIQRLEKQIKKYHEKKIDKTQRRSKSLSEVAEEEGEEAPQIVKRKSVTLKPMTLEEAVLQMDMLDHNFFLFRDADTESICVIYRRRDGNLGLIETT